MSICVKKHDMGLYRVECTDTHRAYTIIRDDMSACYYIDGLNSWYPTADAAIEDATALLGAQDSPLKLVKT